MSIKLRLAFLSQLYLHVFVLVTTVCTFCRVPLRSLAAARLRRLQSLPCPWRSQFHGRLSITTETNYKNSLWAPALLLW